MKDPTKLWFNTPDSHTLCRAGGNGPDHPSQLYAFKKYFKPEMPYKWILDYGAGSATTLEALQKEYGTNPQPFYYVGLDIIPKNVEWCIKNFPGNTFKVNKTIHKIDEPDKSFDIVYSRHVVDHMETFEGPMDEHCRVSKDLVIVVFWVPLSTQPEHEIKHIIDQGKVYEDEYTNQYSREKVMEWIADKEKNGWELLEFKEDVGVEVKGHDWIIVLKRKEVEHESK